MSKTGGWASLFGPSKQATTNPSSTVYLVAIRLCEGGSAPQDIVEVIWVASNFKSGRCSTGAIIDFMHKGRIAKISDGVQETTVEIVRPDDRSPFIRTSRDLSEPDALLALPRFT
jgi:Protein of unknown function (DUF3892)